MDHIFAIIAQELDCDARSVENVASLLDAGNTIPFIARYRKEAHGGMDDTRLTLADAAGLSAQLTGAAH